MGVSLTYGALPCIGGQEQGSLVGLSSSLHASLLVYCGISEPETKVLRLMYPFPQLHSPDAVGARRHIRYA